MQPQRRNHKFPLKKDRKRKRKPEHPVHEVLVFHEDDNDSWCTISGCTYKSPGNHAGNKLVHLKDKHPDVYKNVMEEWNKTLARKSPLEGPSPSKKPRTSLDKVMMSGPALETHCVRLVTEHGLSFEVLEYKAFKDIINPMLNAMPKRERPNISARVTPSKISGLATRVRQKMAAEMEGRLMSMQVDGCSKGHFIGSNVQYIKDTKTVVRTLAVEELHVRSSAENLKAVLQQILRKYDVPARNIISVTSDNGANYLLAGKLLHVDSETQKDLLDVDGSECDDWLDVEECTDEDGVQSVRCAAHTLQLAVDEALRKDAQLQQTINAVRELAKFLRTPTSVRQLKAVGKTLPQLDVVTRWGSTYTMLKSVVVLRHFFESTMDLTSEERTKNSLTDEQWDIVDDLLADLHPVYAATVKLQAEDLTLGQLLAIWTEAVMELQGRRTALSKEIIKAMEAKSKAAQYKNRSRGERLSLFDYPAFNASVFCDPRFFSLLSQDQNEQAKEYLVTLWEKLPRNRGVEVEPEVTAPQEENGDGEENPFQSFLARKNKERAAAKAAGSRAGSSRARRGRGQVTEPPPTTERAKIRAMLEKYDRIQSLPVKSDVLQFWESKKLVWPELYQVALIVLAIPATQVSVERLFSALRYILRPQRFALSGSRLDDIVFLHANADLVREVAREMLNENLEPEPEESVDDIL
ncbi:Zinc finger BED domain-containing protein 4 [Frankliniella fusca]|uniref:Zinc finger BED domain-containing protein 4 n=1 Tax=Frankliniella fusca TaxID=407009 RepID=A0AAE1HXF8_9NEOP|nr:Zinc finger BED domain-containing protein 4 [Frankliniella fusca]